MVGIGKVGIQMLPSRGRSIHSESLCMEGVTHVEKYRAALLMTGLAILCLVIHFYSGWKADIAEAAMHGESAAFSEYIVTWVRDTFENLQSEFWQLAVQFALLAGFFEFMRVKAYEEDEEDMKQRLARIEAKLDGNVLSK